MIIHATVTKSMGLPADALAFMVYAPDSYRDLQKRMPIPTHTATPHTCDKKSLTITV